jgi:integrase
LRPAPLFNPERRSFQARNVITFDTACDGSVTVRRRAPQKPVLCDDGRIRNYRAHGLRKAALRTLAHAGCTGVELMSVSGHSSLDQVQEYLDEVDQERAAEAAMVKLAQVPEIKTATSSDYPFSRR